PTTIIVASVIGGIAWWTYIASVQEIHVTGIVASGIAAMVIGLIGTIISRFWRTPSSALIMAGIVPLVPGLTLYNGLLQVVNGATDYSTFAEGTLTLFAALMIALSIASGASLGMFIGRPLRRTLVKARNALPRRELQSRAD